MVPWLNSSADSSRPVDSAHARSHPAWRNRRRAALSALGSLGSALLAVASLSTFASAPPAQAQIPPAQPSTQPEARGERSSKTAGEATFTPTGPWAHTYSIVARDAKTSTLGVAVQSHWFQVGPTVAWAQAGVGAVATQSLVKIDYGPLGLERLATGESPRQALDALLEEDPERAVRQVAMIDAQGRTAAWTGDGCIAEAGHLEGDGFSVQANLMDKDTVWAAMAQAFEDSEGELAQRLMAALRAAEAEGGDIRGRQSAALVVVRAESTGKAWEDRLVDLRVDDHPQPLDELERLLTLSRAYTWMNRGDEAMAEERIEDAVQAYSTAAELAPQIAELPFWKAVALYSAGHRGTALPIFQDVFQREDRWRRVVPRLVTAGLMPAAVLEEKVLGGQPSAGEKNSSEE
ncbi:MAG: DUF1028 domain-containing protein [Acidobacteriota bacterium]